MLLAVDTSSRCIGLSLYDGMNILGEIVWYSPDYHTSQLAALAADLFKRQGMQITHLKAVGIAIGPGGFTGLRAGLAFSKELAFAAHCVLVGVPSLDALVFAQGIEHFSPLIYQRPLRFAAVLQAGRTRLAVGWYSLKNIEHLIDTKGEIVFGVSLPTGFFLTRDGCEILTVEGLREKLVHSESDKSSALQGEFTIVCGELHQRERQGLQDLPQEIRISSPAHSLRHPASLAELAWRRWQAGLIDDAASLIPIYLH